MIVKTNEERIKKLTANKKKEMSIDIKILW